MRHIYSFIFILIFSVNSLFSYQDVDFEKFHVRERWFSLTTTFDIETDDLKLGYVHRKLLSLTPEYHFYDNQDHLQAVAKMRFFSLMPTFEITDAEGFPIGMVEEKLRFFFPAFSISYPNGEILATAERNFWGTKYSMYRPYCDDPVAVLSRPLFRIKNNWTLHILEPGVVRQGFMDVRMLIVVAAFQTDLEHWKKISEEHMRKHESRFTGYSMIAQQYDPLQMRINHMLNCLNQYSFDQELVEESDVTAVEKLTNDMIEHNQDVNATDEREKALIICEGLLPYLESSDLTPNEKMVLHAMIHAKVQELKL